MPRKKEIFTIREAELIQWLSISHKRLDEIVSFFDADPNDDWDLVEGDDYQFVNKEKKLRNFSPKGAFKIASYIEKNEKRGIIYRFREFFTKHDAKLNKTVNHLQQRTDKPLELGVDFYEDEKREFWFSESGIVMISKSMSETLTNKSRQEMCKMIVMEFPRAFKEIQEHLDDDTKQKIEIEKAKKRAKTRDKNTCQVTGQKPDKDVKFNLAVHHLYSVQKYPHLATLDLNLVTIKEEIHQEFHGNLGGFHQPCTIEDFIEFLHIYYPEHQGNLAFKLQKTKKKLEKLAK